jgi:hypothetical protein
LIVASPDTLIPYQSYYFAPLVTQLLPGPRVRTPPVTPSRAAGGGEAPESSQSPNQNFSWTEGDLTGHMLFSDLGAGPAQEAATVDDTVEEEGPSQPAGNDWATQNQLPINDQLTEIEAKIMAECLAQAEAARVQAEADHIERTAKLNSHSNRHPRSSTTGGAGGTCSLPWASLVPRGRLQTPVTPVTHVSLSSAFSVFEARLAGVSSDPAHHQPDPMDIELANTIASAKKSIHPREDSQPAVHNLRICSRAEWKLGSLPAWSARRSRRADQAPRKGRTAKSSTDVPSKSSNQG